MLHSVRMTLSRRRRWRRLDTVIEDAVIAACVITVTTGHPSVLTAHLSMTTGPARAAVLRTLLMKHSSILMIMVVILSMMKVVMIVKCLVLVHIKIPSLLVPPFLLLPLLPGVAAAAHHRHDHSCAGAADSCGSCHLLHAAQAAGQGAELPALP